MTVPIDHEALLDRFRRWLQEAGAEAEPAPEPVEEVGLLRLVEEFTALRHEIKLQTKGSRGLQEQVEALRPALVQAIEHFRSVSTRDAQASWASGKALAEALADLDEALDRGRAEIEKARAALVEGPTAELEGALEELRAEQSWPMRTWTRRYHEAALELVRQRGPATRGPLFAALLEGYSLIQARLHRAMSAERLERVVTLGRPADPELMTVVEVVEDPDRPPGEVVGELRRGYTWRGRVLRYAEVRAARGPVGPNGEGEGQSTLGSRERERP